MGIRPDRAAQYMSDGAGTHIAYDAMAQAQVSRRTMGTVAPSWNAAPNADAAARGGNPGARGTGSPKRFRLFNR